MPLLTVLKFPNLLLKKISTEVSRFDGELKSLADAMLETMYQKGGVGLAAPQVGQLKRLIVVHVSEGEGEEEMSRPVVMVNPAILQVSGEIVTEEGCLSVVEYTAEVKRARSILVKYQTVSGEEKEEELTDLKAVCVQHEIDHLNGKLFIDRLSPLKRQLIRKKLIKLSKSA